MCFFLGNSPGVWILYADVSEHCVCSIFISRYVGTYPSMKMEQIVPKLRHIKFRRRGITQKKAYNIQNTAKVWDQECTSSLSLWRVRVTGITMETQQRFSLLRFWTQICCCYKYKKHLTWSGKCNNALRLFLHCIFPWQLIKALNIIFCWPCILLWPCVNDQLDAQLRYIKRLLL